MGVTRLKGRPRPWKVDYYETAVIDGRVVKRRRAKFFRNKQLADDYWHTKALEFDAYEAGLSQIIPRKFSDFKHDYLNTYLAYRSPSYQRSETCRLNAVADHFGDVELHRVTAAGIQSFLYRLMDEGISTKTAKNYLGLISGIFTQARLRQHVKENPCSNVSLPAVIQRREARSLTPLELTKLLRAATARERDALLVFVHTGIRLDEFMRIRVERDVDFKNNVLFVRSTEAAPTKNRKPRTIPLTKVAVSIFRRVKVGPVIPGLKYHGVQSMLERLRDRTGISFTAHWLRHTFSSFNQADGVPESVVQGWLGHGSSSITKRYTHTRGLDQRWATMTFGEQFVSCASVATPLEMEG